MKLIYLLVLISCVQCALGHAWKPIVGQAPAPTSTISGSKATSATFTSSFSLQQSHPDYSNGKSAYASEAHHGANKELIIKEVPVALPVSLHDEPEESFKTYATAVPSAINFADARFGYKAGGAVAYSEDQCSVKKYAFNHDGVVQYDNEIPELAQFTICFWMRFTNHSGDHVILTYSGKLA